MHGNVTLKKLNEQAAEAAEILARHGMTLLFSPGDQAVEVEVVNPEPEGPQPDPFGRPDARYIQHGEHLWVLPLTTTGRGCCAALVSRYAVRQGQWYVVHEEYQRDVFQNLLAAGLTLSN